MQSFGIKQFNAFLNSIHGGNSILWFYPNTNSLECRVIRIRSTLGVIPLFQYLTKKNINSSGVCWCHLSNASLELRDYC